MGKMFCPACQSDLHEHTLLDPNLRGYICGNDHVYFVTLVEQAGGIPTIHNFEPPPIDDDVEVMKFWLTNPRARERLPNQLGWVCRRLIEIAEGNRRVAKLEQPFAFCPLCGDPLGQFESDDVYLQGSRCRNSHEFWDRGGSAYYKHDGVNAHLTTELMTNSFRSSSRITRETISGFSPMCILRCASR